jgi:RND family efflux transporter MFP subunit
MPPEPPRPALRGIESLRIHRPPKVQRTSRLLPGALAVFAALAAALTGYFVYVSTLGRPLAVQAAVVQTKLGGQPGVILTGSGYIVTRRKYITVGTKILGQIVAEPIEEGQHVKVGDLLARIDDGDYQAQLRQALADRDLAAADVKLAQARAARLRELYRTNVQSRDQLDAAENALAVAKAGLEKAKAEVAFARFNVSQCEILSPIDGIVLQKYRELGDTINYGAAVGSGGGTSDIVQLADTTDMRAEVDINESDISKVAMQAPAAVVLDAYPDRSFAARVSKIYPEADRQKGTIEVEVHILHPDLTLIKPEMSAKVNFLAAPARPHQTPLVIVPKQAVMGEAGANFVWLVRDGKARRTAIVPGAELQDGIQVKQGLSGGELVIVAPPANLGDGQAVAPANPS